MSFIKDAEAVKDLLPCEDVISRRAAIDVIKGYFRNEYYQRTSICRERLIEDVLTLYEIQTVLEDLPPISPARPKGEWIDYSDEGYVECPFCHNATNCEGNIDELHYCFSCGANNGGEQE